MVPLVLLPLQQADVLPGCACEYDCHGGELPGVAFVVSFTRWEWPLEFEHGLELLQHLDSSKLQWDTYVILAGPEGIQIISTQGVSLCT